MLLCNQEGAEPSACHAGVLKWKKAAEEMIQQKGVPYTVFRLGRLTDGACCS